MNVPFFLPEKISNTFIGSFSESSFSDSSLFPPVLIFRVNTVETQNWIVLLATVPYR